MENSTYICIYMYVFHKILLYTIQFAHQDYASNISKNKTYMWIEWTLDGRKDKQLFTLKIFIQVSLSQ